MLILDAIIKEIARNNLLGLVKESGRVLMSGLGDIQVGYIYISLLYYTQKCVKLLVHGGSLGCSQCDSCETIVYFIVRLCITRIWYLFPLQAKYPFLIHSVRGVGIFYAFDCYSTETRNKLVFNLRNRGDYYACFNYLRLLVARCTRLHILCVLQVLAIGP